MVFLRAESLKNFLFLLRGPKFEWLELVFFAAPLLGLLTDAEKAACFRVVPM